MGKNLVLSQKCHPFAAHFDQRRYLTKLIKSRASARPEHKADRRARANVHDEQHRKPHREHQKKAAAKRLLHTLFLPCAPILRHERGDRGAAAVAERVGKALDARVFARCGITPNLKFSTMDSLATYSMVEAGLGLAMNNALNGRAFAGGVRILPLDPPQIVEIGAATLPDLSPAAQTFLDFLEPHLVEFLSEKS